MNLKGPQICLSSKLLEKVKLLDLLFSLKSFWRAPKCQPTSPEILKASEQKISKASEQKMDLELAFPNFVKNSQIFLTTEIAQN